MERAEKEWAISTVRQVPWVKIAVEAIAIVGSILLAFAIQAWWEGVGEAERREALLAGLAADFADAEMRLNSDSVYTATAFNAAQRWLELARDPSGVPDLAATSDTLANEILFVGAFDAPMGSVNALVNGGDMSVLGDPELARELTAWSVTVASLKERQENQRFVYQAQVIPFLVESGVRIADLAGWTDVPLPAPVPPRRTDAYLLLSDTEWESIVTNVWFAAYDVRNREALTRSSLARVSALIRANQDAAN